jgi:hypothetical protein
MITVTDETTIPQLQELLITEGLELLGWDLDRDADEEHPWCVAVRDRLGLAGWGSGKSSTMAWNDALRDWSSAASAAPASARRCDRAPSWR